MSNCSFVFEYIGHHAFYTTDCNTPIQSILNSNAFTAHIEREFGGIHVPQQNLTPVFRPMPLNEQETIKQWSQRATQLGMVPTISFRLPLRTDQKSVCQQLVATSESLAEAIKEKDDLRKQYDELKASFEQSNTDEYSYSQNLKVICSDCAALSLRVKQLENDMKILNENNQKLTSTVNSLVSEVMNMKKKQSNNYLCNLIYRFRRQMWSIYGENLQCKYVDATWTDFLPYLKNHLETEKIDFPSLALIQFVCNKSKYGLDTHSELEEMKEAVETLELESERDFYSEILNYLSNLE